MARLSLVATIAVVAGALVLPAAAPAATIEHTATSGPSGEDYIVYSAGKRERNRLTVIGGRKTITFIDRGARIRRKRGGFKGCRVRSAHRAVCRLDPFTAMDILLRDRNDRVRFRGRDLSTRLGATPRGQAGAAQEHEDSYPEDEGQLGYRTYISGGSGNDVLNGTRGVDWILPGAGRNQVDGGTDSDRIVAAPSGRADRLRGGRGIDTIEVATDQPVQVDMGQGTVTEGGRTDRLNSVERVHSGDGDDTIRGSEGSDGLFGDGGDDRIDGLGGPDYLGGDLGTFGERPEPGVDTLNGGAGDDALDGRDREAAEGTPTDQLVCGDGADAIVARGDDLADSTCEQSAFGRFTGALVDFEQSVFFTAPSLVQPVARAANGAPTYRIACPGADTTQENPRCTGRVEVRRPPVAGGPAETELLGYGEFSFPPNSQQNVPVTLNSAGQAAFAGPEATVSVRVVMGAQANPRPPGSTQQPTPGPDAEFGWQQRLTR